MDKNFFIYVLQLSNNMYYIHADCAEHFELQNIYYAAALKSSFVRTHMPVKQIIEKKYASSTFKIDAKVKEYMMKYGYNYVRGGSYSEEYLSSEQINVIQREMIYASSMNYMGPENHIFIKQYSEELMKMSENERTIHINTICVEYEKFLKEKHEYENLQKMMDEVCVGEPLIKKLDFLKNQCQIIYRSYACPMPPCPQHFMGHRESQTIIDIYRILCKKFKQLAKIFNNVYPDQIEIDHILTKHPEFILDDFIFHKHYVANKSRYDTVEYLLNQYKFMCNKLINRLEEYKFSAYSWDTQLENKIILMKLITGEK